MLLTPKRRKHRKQMVKPVSGKAKRGSSIAFGTYGLKAITSGFVTNRQLESARKVISRYTKKVGKMWMRVFPDVPITKLGLEMPMGKGKGEVDRYAARVQRGRVMFEVTGLGHDVAMEVLTKASKKLPTQCRVIVKGDIR